MLSTKIDWIATLLRIPGNQECAYFLRIMTWRFGGKFAYEGFGVRATCSIELHILSAKSNWNTSKNITAQNPSPHFQNPWTPRMRLFLSIHKLIITVAKFESEEYGVGSISRIWSAKKKSNRNELEHWNGLNQAIKIESHPIGHLLLRIFCTLLFPLF